MTSLRHEADGIAYGDLAHLGRSEVVAVYLMETSDGLAIVDPGPSSCRDGLQQAIQDFGATVDDVRHVLLTHIHLDHAGIVGTLAREYPKIKVHVHARGAPHLADGWRVVAVDRDARTYTLGRC